MTGGPAAGAVGSGRADAGAVGFDVVDSAEFGSLIPALAEVLADAVDSGASVNFLAPFPVAVLASPGPAGDELVDVLVRLGLRRLADVAAADRVAGAAAA